MHGTDTWKIKDILYKYVYVKQTYLHSGITYIIKIISLHWYRFEVFVGSVGFKMYAYILYNLQNPLVTARTNNY